MTDREIPLPPEQHDEDVMTDKEIQLTPKQEAALDVVAELIEFERYVIKV